MAKSFYTDGVGNQQTLTNSQNEKILIYDTLADAQSDLANLEEGQIIGTKGPFNQMSLVDVVQVGNMNAVTSNAVAIAIGNWTEILDLSTDSSHIFKIYGMQLGTHKIVWFHLQAFWDASGGTSYTQGTTVGTLPVGWRPTNIPSDDGTLRNMVHCGYSDERRVLGIEILTDGTFKFFVFGSPKSGAVTINGVWGDCYFFLS